MLHRKAAPSNPDPYCQIKVARELRQALDFRCRCDVIKDAIRQGCRTCIVLALIGTHSSSVGQLEGIARWLRQLL